MNERWARGAVLAALLGLTLPASVPAVLACGHCLEDRIAAVYDHAMVTEARAHRHPIVYLAVGSPGPETPARLARVRRQLAATPGVDAHSVRTDSDAAAAAFSFDPARLDWSSWMPRLRTLAGGGVRCDTLRVVRH